MYDSVDSFAAGFKRQNPEYESWGPKTLHSTLVRLDPGINEQIAGSPAPEFTEPSQIIASYRRNNASRFAPGATDEDVRRDLAASMPELADAWGLGDKAPEENIVEAAPELDEEEPVDEFGRMFGDWYGRRPTKPLEEYKNGANLLGLAEKNQEGRQGFFEALKGDKASQWVPYVGDAVDAVEIGKILKTAHKMEDGNLDDVTDEEIVDFNYYMQRLKREDEGGWRAMAGAIVRTSILFGAEMAASLGTLGWWAGGAKVAKKAGIEALEATAKKAGTEAVETFGEKVVSRAAKSVGKLGLPVTGTQGYSALRGTKQQASRLYFKALGEQVKEEVAEKLGKGAAAKMAAGAAGFVADAGPLAAISLGGKTAVDALLTGAMSGDPTTASAARMRLQNVMSGKDDPAFAAASADMFIEYLSEYSGEYLTSMIANAFGGPGASAKRIVGERYQAFMEAAGKRFGSTLKAALPEAAGKNIGKVARYLAGVAERGKSTTADAFAKTEFMKNITALGYDNVVGEMLEERFGGFLRGMTGLQGDEHQSYMKNVWDATLPQSTDAFLAELVAFSLPAGANLAGRNVGRFIAGQFDRNYDSLRAAQVLNEQGKGFDKLGRDGAPVPGDIPGAAAVAETPKEKMDRINKEREGTSLPPISEDKAVAGTPFTDSRLQVQAFHYENLVRRQAQEPIADNSAGGHLINIANWLLDRSLGLQYLSDGKARALGLDRGGLVLTAQERALRAGVAEIGNQGYAKLQAALQNPEGAYRQMLNGTTDESKRLSPERREAEALIIMDTMRADLAKQMANITLRQKGAIDLSEALPDDLREVFRLTGLTEEQLAESDASFLADVKAGKYKGMIYLDPSTRTWRMTTEGLLMVDDPVRSVSMLMRGISPGLVDIGNPVLREATAQLRDSLAPLARLEVPVEDFDKEVTDPVERLARYLHDSASGIAGAPDITHIMGSADVNHMLNPGEDTARSDTVAELSRRLLQDRADNAGAHALEKIARATRAYAFEGRMSAKLFASGTENYANPLEALGAMLVGDIKSAVYRDHWMALTGHDPLDPASERKFDAMISQLRDSVKLAAADGSALGIWKGREVLVRATNRKAVVSTVSPKAGGAVTYTYEDGTTGTTYSPASDLEFKAVALEEIVLVPAPMTFGGTRAQLRAESPAVYRQLGGDGEASDKHVVRMGYDGEGTAKVRNRDKDYLVYRTGASVSNGGRTLTVALLGYPVVEDTLEANYRRWKEGVQLEDYFIKALAEARARLAEKTKNPEAQTAKPADTERRRKEKAFLEYMAGVDAASQKVADALRFELFGKVFALYHLDWKNELTLQGARPNRALNDAADALATLLGYGEEVEGAAAPTKPSEFALLLEQMHNTYLKFMSPEAIEALRYDRDLEWLGAEQAKKEKSEVKASRKYQKAGKGLHVVQVGRDGTVRLGIRAITDPGSGVIDFVGYYTLLDTGGVGEVPNPLSGPKPGDADRRVIALSPEEPRHAKALEARDRLVAAARTQSVRLSEQRRANSELVAIQRETAPGKESASALAAGAAKDRVKKAIAAYREAVVASEEAYADFSKEMLALVKFEETSKPDVIDPDLGPAVPTGSKPTPPAGDAPPAGKKPKRQSKPKGTGKKTSKAAKVDLDQEARNLHAQREPPPPPPPGVSNSIDEPPSDLAAREEAFRSSAARALKNPVRATPPDDLTTSIESLGDVVEVGGHTYTKVAAPPFGNVYNREDGVVLQPEDLLGLVKADSRKRADEAFKAIVPVPKGAPLSAEQKQAAVAAARAAVAARAAPELPSSIVVMLPSGGIAELERRGDGYVVSAGPGVGERTFTAAEALAIDADNALFGQSPERVVPSTAASAVADSIVAVPVARSAEAFAAIDALFDKPLVKLLGPKELAKKLRETMPFTANVVAGKSSDKVLPLATMAGELIRRGLIKSDRADALALAGVRLAENLSRAYSTPGFKIKWDQVDGVSSIDAAELIYIALTDPAMDRIHRIIGAENIGGPADAASAAIHVMALAVRETTNPLELFLERIGQIGEGSDPMILAAVNPGNLDAIRESAAELSQARDIASVYMEGSARSAAEEDSIDNRILDAFIFMGYGESGISALRGFVQLPHSQIDYLGRNPDAPIRPLDGTPNGAYAYNYLQWLADKSHPTHAGKLLGVDVKLEGSELDFWQFVAEARIPLQAFSELMLRRLAKRTVPQLRLELDSKGAAIGFKDLSLAARPSGRIAFDIAVPVEEGGSIPLAEAVLAPEWDAETVSLDAALSTMGTSELPPPDGNAVIVVQALGKLLADAEVLARHPEMARSIRIRIESVVAEGGEQLSKLAADAARVLKPLRKAMGTGSAKVAARSADAALGSRREKIARSKESLDSDKGNVAADDIQSPGEQYAKEFIRKLYAGVAESALLHDDSKQSLPQHLPSGVSAALEALGDTAEAFSIEEIEFGGDTAKLGDINTIFRPQALLAANGLLFDGKVHVVMEAADRTTGWGVSLSPEAADAIRIAKIDEIRRALQDEESPVLRKQLEQASEFYAEDTPAARAAAVRHEIVKKSLSEDGAKKVLGKLDSMKREGLLTGGQATPAITEEFKKRNVSGIVISQMQEVTPAGDVDVADFLDGSMAYGDELGKLLASLGLRPGAKFQVINGTKSADQASDSAVSKPYAESMDVARRTAAMREALAAKGGIPIPAESGGQAFMLKLLPEFEKEIAGTGKKIDFITTTGAEKVYGAPGGKRIELAVEFGGKKYKILARVAEFPATAIRETSVLDHEGRPAYRALSIATASNLSPFGEAELGAVAGYQAATTDAAIREAGLDGLAAGLVKATEKGDPLAARAVALAPIGSPYGLERAYSAVNTMMMGARLGATSLGGLLTPHAATSDQVEKGEASSAHLAPARHDAVAGKAMPGNYMVNDASLSTAYQMWVGDEIEAVGDIAAQRAELSRAIKLLAKASGALSTRDQQKLLAETGEVEGVSAAELVEARAFADRYLFDHTGAQRPRLMEDMSWAIDKNGLVRHGTLVREKDGVGKERWLIRPSVHYTERFPGGQNLVARGPLSPSAPVTLELRRGVSEMYIKPDGTPAMRKVSRVESGTENRVRMDALTNKRRGTDNDGDAGYGMYAGTPYGHWVQAPAEAEVLSTLAGTGKVPKAQEWLSRFMLERLHEAFDRLPAEAWDGYFGTIDAGVLLDVEVTPDEVFRDLLPASELAGGRATIKRLGGGTLSQYASLMPRYRALMSQAASESGDRGMLVTVSDSLQKMLGMRIPLLGDATEKGFPKPGTSRLWASGPFALNLGTPLRETGSKLAISDLIMLKLMTDVMNAKVDGIKNVAGEQFPFSREFAGMLGAAAYSHTFIRNVMESVDVDNVRVIREAGPDVQRRTPGTVLNFLQSWNDYFETDPVAKLFRETMAELRKSGMEIPSYWDHAGGVFEAMQKRAATLPYWTEKVQSGLDSSKTETRLSSLEALAAPFARLYAAGDEIRKFGTLTKATHSGFASMREMFRMGRILQGVENSRMSKRRKLAKTDEEPQFHYLDIENFSSSPLFAQLQGFYRLFKDLAGKAHISGVPQFRDMFEGGVVSHAGEKAFKLVSAAANSGLLRDAAFAAYPQLVSFANAQIIPLYEKLEDGAADRAKLAALLTADLATQSRLLETSQKDARQGSTELAEKVANREAESPIAVAMALERAEQAMLAAGTVAARAMMAVQGGVPDEKLSQARAYLRVVSARETPKMNFDKPLARNRRRSGEEIGFRPGYPGLEADSDVSLAIEFLRGIFSGEGQDVAIKVPMTTWFHEAKTLAHKVDKEAQEKSPSPSAWHPGKHTVRVTSDLVVPLLAFGGMSMNGTSVSQASGNPAPWLPAAEQRRIGAAVSAIIGRKVLDGAKNREAAGMSIAARLSGAAYRSYTSNGTGGTTSYWHTRENPGGILLSAFNPETRKLGNLASPYDITTSIESLANRSMWAQGHMGTGELKVAYRRSPDYRGFRDLLGRIDRELRAGRREAADALATEASEELARLGNDRASDTFAAGYPAEADAIAAEGPRRTRPIDVPLTAKDVRELWPRDLADVKREIKDLELGAEAYAAQPGDAQMSLADLQLKKADDLKAYLAKRAVRERAQAAKEAGSDAVRGAYEAGREAVVKELGPELVELFSKPELAPILDAAYWLSGRILETKPGWTEQPKFHAAVAAGLAELIENNRLDEINKFLGGRVSDRWINTDEKDRFQEAVARSLGILETLKLDEAARGFPLAEGEAVPEPPAEEWAEGEAPLRLGLDDTYSILAPDELFSNYLSWRMALGGEQYLHDLIIDTKNWMSGWDRRTNLELVALSRLFGDGLNRRIITLRTKSKKDAGPDGSAKYDYADTLLHRLRGRVAGLAKDKLRLEKTAKMINEQSLFDYIVTAIQERTKRIAPGIANRNVVYVEDPENPGKPLYKDGQIVLEEFVYIRKSDGRALGPAEAKAEVGRRLERSIADQRGNKLSEADMATQIFAVDPATNMLKHSQVNGYNEETGEITTPLMDLEVAKALWFKSDLYKALTEQMGREAWEIAPERIAAAASKSLAEFHEQATARGLAQFPGGARVIGHVANYVPHIFGGHGFESAERQLARERVHKLATLYGRRSGFGALDTTGRPLPPQMFAIKHQELSKHEPLAQQRELFLELSKQLDVLLRARGQRPADVAGESDEASKEWDLMQFNYAILRLAVRVETEKSFDAGDGYSKDLAGTLSNLHLIAGLKNARDNYAEEEWSPHMGTREFATYEEALIIGDYKGNPLSASITDPLRLMATSIKDIVNDVSKSLLVSSAMIIPSANGPLVIAIPSKSKDKSLDNRGKDLRSLVRQDALRAQIKMMAAAAGIKVDPSGDAGEQLEALMRDTRVNFDKSKYRTVRSDYQSVKEFLVLDEGQLPKLFQHIVGTEAQLIVATPGGRQYDMLRILSRANQFMKHMAVGWSLFFMTAGIESVIAGTSLRKNMAFFFRGMGSSDLNSDKQWQAWKRVASLGRDMRRGDLALASKLQRYHEAGLVISERNISDGSSTVIDGIISRVAESARARWGDEGAARVRSGMRVLAGRQMSEWLMGDFFGGLKLWAADNLIEEMKEKNPHLSEASILEIVAPIVNNAYGGQNWAHYAWATPRTLQLLNLLMFAPNWTLSAWNIAGGGLVTGHALGNYMSPEAIKFTVRNWVSMYLIALQLVPNLLQAVIYGLGHILPDDDGDEAAEAQDKLLAWNNEAGKGGFFPSIDITPLMRKMPGYSGDPTGKRRVYARFGKQSYEVLQGWLTDPASTLGRKSSMVVKAVWEQAFGFAPGSSDFELPFSGLGINGFVDSKIGFRGSRAAVLLSKTVPMTWSSMLTNPDAYITAFLVPAAKGMSQTRAIQGMVNLLSEYAEVEPANRHPTQRANLEALASEYVDALERNGYDSKQVVTSAKGKVLPGYYADFYEAFTKKDSGGMHEAAKKIMRIGGTAEGLERSATSRQVKTGRDPLTDEQKAAIREAFGGALPRFVEQVL